MRVLCLQHISIWLVWCWVAACDQGQLYWLEQDWSGCRTHRQVTKADHSSIDACPAAPGDRFFPAIGEAQFSSLT